MRWRGATKYWTKSITFPTSGSLIYINRMWYFADMAGGGASGGSVVLTNHHHAGMDKNEHSGVRSERIISMCWWPAKTITS